MCKEFDAVDAQFAVMNIEQTNIHAREYGVMGVFVCVCVCVCALNIVSKSIQKYIE